jgi:hypothetical protein
MDIMEQRRALNGASIELAQIYDLKSNRKCSVSSMPFYALHDTIQTRTNNKSILKK